jgi:hypothetical protein
MGAITGKPRRAAAWVAAAAMAAHAAVPDGKGIGNLTYAKDQLGKTLSLIINREGHGWVAMHRGYLMVIYSMDSGLGMGAISFVDVSDPRKPVLVHDQDDSVTHEIREPHGWGLRGDVACLQANHGMHFWDVSDVTKPKLLSYARLPDVQISDYDQGMWWTCWQGGYAYGGGSGNGLYIVDAKDPVHPRFVKKIPVSQLGGFRVGPTFAIGNLLIITGTDVGGASMLDIGDPENPRLLATMPGATSYSSKVNGNKLVLAGSGDENGVALIYDISDHTRFKLLGKTANQGDKGGYVGFADGYAFVGFSVNGFSKIDLSKPDFPVVQTGTSGLPGHDEDFACPLGNLVFVGNDHRGQGSSLIPHQTQPDKTGPEVNMISPADGAVRQPLTSRVGITLTDEPDEAGLTAENFTVRPVGGQPLDGWYAHQSAIVNFTPKEPLQANTTYEVIVRSGGITDYMGNPATKEFRSRFSTGASVTGLARETRTLPVPGRIRIRGGRVLLLRGPGGAGARSDGRRIRPEEGGKR